MIIVVLVGGCYGGHSIRCCYLVLLGRISSSKAGFVQCFERRGQFRRSVFFVGPPTEMASLSVGGHKKTHKHTKVFWNISVLFAPLARRFPQK